jgi:hypothetical protein
MSNNSKNIVEPSNIISGKRYFTSDNKGGFIYLGSFSKKYYIDHYDGPSHPSGTERGYIFQTDDMKYIKIRDDYSNMIFYENK